MISIKSTDRDYTGEHYEGSFACYYNNLDSLEGSPMSVGGYFDCSHNYLTSLEGAPKSVGGVFYCDNNDLKSLEGAPMSVGGEFYCDKNLYNGNNLYIIANALLNGRKDKQDFEKRVLVALTKYFI